MSNALFSMPNLYACAQFDKNEDGWQLIKKHTNKKTFSEQNLWHNLLKTKINTQKKTNGPWIRRINIMYVLNIFTNLFLVLSIKMLELKKLILSITIIVKSKSRTLGVAIICGWKYFVSKE